MTTKEPSRKQVIIFKSKDNVKIIGSNTNFHINSINKSLKEANSNMIVDFMHIEKSSIIITTNQVASSHDMSIIKNILKEFENINWDLIESSCLLQSKLYFKILGLLYLIKDTNNIITPNIVLGVIKGLHLFNNISLTLKPRIIKAFSYSSPAVI